MEMRTDIKITVDDYKCLPEGGPAYQLIDGDLIRMTPAPAPRHGLSIMNLGGPLVVWVNAHGLGNVFAPPVDVYLSKIDAYQPDLVFLSSARADRRRADGIYGGPDLVVEVLSPSTRKYDLGPKLAQYAKSGVIEAWYLDLDERRLAVYRLQENASEPAATFGPTDALASALFPGLAIPLANVLG